MPFESRGGARRPGGEGLLPQIPADEYPYVIEHAEQHLGAVQPGRARRSSSSGST